MENQIVGLAKICKLYGSIEVSDVSGKKVVWVWDYANERPRLEDEMTREEKLASEKAKWLNRRRFG